MPSNCQATATLHVAIIMDGNGRWATGRGMPRSVGHRAGMQSLRRIVSAAPGLGVRTLSVFAFSADNWRRPAAEVRALLGLFRIYLQTETHRLVDSGTRLTVIGRRDRLTPALAEDIALAEQATADGAALTLRVAFDYSARDSILRAAAALPEAMGFGALDHFGRLIAGAGADEDPPNVDLLIRTGGEKRLSDFLLWESAYAELWFTDKPWPVFSPGDLAEAIADFRRRDRRFGGLSQPLAAVAQRDG